MTRRDADDADVAIVGAGPVGTVLAILLGQLGRSVVVLERWPEPYPLPRAVHFDHEVGRIFQSCGIGPELRAISEPVETYEWRNAAGRTLLRFGRAGDGPSGWPLSSMFNQPALEALLEGRARSLPAVEIRRGVEAVGLAQDGGSVRLSTSAGDVRAGFVVGCDGANSTTARLLGVPVCDLGFFYDWLVVDVVLDAPRDFDPPNLQICDPARPTTVVSGGPGRRRWEFMRLPDEPAEELNLERRAWELLAPFDVHPGNARLERHAVYTFRAQFCETWRVGRTFLAGDAAHLMPPFAGQGMCAGIRDAANLAWKLDLVLGGLAPDGLLDTFEAERLPNARTAIEFSIELGKVICVPDPAEAAARDEAMAAAVGPEAAEIPGLPGLETGLIHPEAPMAGTLLPQPIVGGRPFDDVHGAGWRCIVGSRDARPGDGALLSWFESIGGRVVEGGSWPGGGEQPACVLQRPDFHLYGAAGTAEGASRLLADLRAQLAGTPAALTSD